MKKSIIITIVVLALVALAAVWYFMLRGKDSEVTAEPPVPYVSDIINDSYSSEHKLVSGYDPQDRSKAIFVFGSRSRTQAVAGALMESDAYDNVDGSSNPDGLKDFAGETVCTVANFSNFGEMVNDGRLEDLRELTTRNVLAAMDTLCFVSPYDRSGMGKKPLAKLIILGSACMTQYGQYDIDSLFNALNCHLPVITPMQLIVDEAVSTNKGKDILSVGVLAGNAPVDLYGPYIRTKAARMGIDSVLCVGFKVPEGEDPLLSFLDRYSELGIQRPLDVILVDDLGVDLSAFKESLECITSVMNAESLTYGNLISPGFKIIDSRSRICKATYSILRKENLFTHLISQPRQLDYMLIPKSGSEKAMMLLQYNERYIPQNN
ncbi:MAG: hypothetical protein II687_02860 [Selenomonadaceae bacterium]|nr:hypothetical protein [Selenomonadaceae bacterium]